MKIAICASEVVPFAKTGGLADVAGALPLALEKEGHEVIVIMPKYKDIKNGNFDIKKFNNDVYSCVIGDKTKVYFIDNEKYFGREGLYGGKNGDHKDNLERFSYYCSRTLSFLKEIGFRPDIIHCHDWQSSLIPIYLKASYTNDQFFSKTKTLLTIHNIGYQGIFPRDEFIQLGLDWIFFDVNYLEFYGKINLLKGGIVFADLINTVSPTYAKEIKTKEFGFGLEGVLDKRKGSVFGILNGLDYDVWDPQADKFIANKFSALEPAGKLANKADLQRSCKLPELPDSPLIGIVSRLAEQKGFDILCEGINDICDMGIQLVILGTGDAKYHKLLDGVAKKQKKSVSVNLRFDDPLAHKIYAGSDIFLMPSKYEPCGLGQMIAFRYGAVPIVFNTGGLADTVNSSNGFVFDSYSKAGLIKTVKKALLTFKDREKWNRLVLNGMNANFSWATAARKYSELYEKAK